MISVIVPMYNAEQYIADCVRSVQRQTYTDFELILVDDGSCDETRKICHRLQVQDSRIKVLSNQHKGVSAARNEGIRKAQGEYLFFLDSDDMIHPQLLECLWGFAQKTGAKILTGGYCYVQSKDLSKQMMEAENESEIGTYVDLDHSSALECFIYGGRKRVLLAVGGKMILRDAAKEIWFDEQHSNGEDTKYIYQLLADGGDTVIVERNWYYCRRHEGNASRRETFTACKSMYEVERYICDQERKKGRAVYARMREYFIIRRVLDWYMDSRRAHDKGRIQYFKKVSERERTLAVWQEISPGTKWEFYLAFHCYPIYLPLYRGLKGMLALKERIYEMTAEEK